MIAESHRGATLVARLHPDGRGRWGLSLHAAEPHAPRLRPQDATFATAAEALAAGRALIDGAAARPA